MWVLIIFLFGYSPAPITVTFESEKHCMEAQAWVKKINTRADAQCFGGAIR